MKAIVLCAGFGSRLAPLTDRLPKPLVPVANRPVLDLVLDRLLAAGVEEVGVNLHHCADRIEAHLKARREGPKIRTAYEPQILDTAGGIANFCAWVERSSDACVLVHNSDIVTDIDLHAAVADHLSSGAAVTIVCVDHAPTNVVAVAADGSVLDIHGRIAHAPGAQTFSGITVLSRPFLRRLIPGVRASVIDAIVAQILDMPGSVRAHFPRAGAFWRDLGQVSHYLELHREMLVGGRFLPPGVPLPRNGILVDPAARIEPSAKLEGFVAVGPDCHIGCGVHLANCVVWSGTRLVGKFAADKAVILEDLVVAA